jgi:hypothetical protein
MRQEHKLRKLNLEKQELELRLDLLNEELKNYEEASKEELNKIIEEAGLIPLENKEKSILVIDINYLPSELKGNSCIELAKFLEPIYGYKVLIIDSSRQNLEGSRFDGHKPAYFI